MAWTKHKNSRTMLQFLISNWSLASAFCPEVFVVTQHCTKKSKYGVISGSYFPVFGLNTEIHGVNTDQKYGPKITPYLGNFHAVQKLCSLRLLPFDFTKFKNQNQCGKRKIGKYFWWKNMLVSFFRYSFIDQPLLWFPLDSKTCELYQISIS